MKPFVVAAALASGKYHEDSIIDTSPGYVKVGNTLVEEEHGSLGRINIATILAKSSNVGMTMVALSLEPQQMWSTLSQPRLRSGNDERLPRRVRRACSRTMRTGGRSRSRA